MCFESSEGGGAGAAIGEEGVDVGLDATGEGVGGVTWLGGTGG